MPTITITLSDTPAGGIAIHSSFKPAVGAPVSPAQAEALDIIRRTSKAWGLRPVVAALHSTQNNSVSRTL